jgi:ATP-dependent protease ClpP protease subunit
LFAQMVASAGGQVGEIHIYDILGKTFFGEGVSAADVVQALKSVEGCSRLDVRINSPGGSVWEALAIYNLLKVFPAPKTVYVDGLAASMASIVACAGDRIVTGKSALWMIHEPRVDRVERGTADDHRKTAAAVDKLCDGMCGTYCDRTKQKPEDVRAWMAAETWMTAREAKERGFTDEIAEQQDAHATAFTPAAAQFLSLFANTPAALRAVALASVVPPPVKPAPTSQEPVMLKFLCAALGLADTATEVEVQAAITKRLESARLAGEQLVALVALTGKTSVDEAKGIVAAWKAGAEQIPALSAKVTDLEKKLAGDKLEQLIAKGKTDGKLAPAMEAWAKTQSIEALTAYLEVAPKVAPTARVDERPSAGATAVAGPVADIAAQCGVTPDALAKYRENPNPTAPATK